MTLLAGAAGIASASGTKVKTAKSIKDAVGAVAPGYAKEQKRIAKLRQDVANRKYTLEQLQQMPRKDALQAENALWEYQNKMLPGAQAAIDYDTKINEEISLAKQREALKEMDYDPTIYRQRAGEYDLRADLYDPTRGQNRLYREGQAQGFDAAMQQAYGEGPTIGQQMLESEMMRGNINAQRTAQQAALSAGASPAAAAQAAMMSSDNFTRGLGQQIAATGAADRMDYQQYATQLASGLGQQELSNYLSQKQLADTQFDKANAASAELMGLSHQAGIGYQQINTQENIAAMQDATARRGQNLGIAGAAIGAAGAVGAGFAKSDKNAKKNMAKQNSGTLVDRLASVDPYAFDYKDKRDGEGRHLGVMAQDLEKAGLGHAVTEDDDGTKYLDNNKILSMILASQAALADEVKSLKGKRK